jgi:hypothetical protein
MKAAGYNPWATSKRVTKILDWIVGKELIPNPSVEAMHVLAKIYQDLNLEGSFSSSGEVGGVVVRSTIDTQSREIPSGASFHVNGSRSRSLDTEMMGNHGSISRQ